MEAAHVVGDCVKVVENWFWGVGFWSDDVGAHVERFEREIHLLSDFLLACDLSICEVEKAAGTTLC